MATPASNNRPPMPAFLFKVMNPLMKALLLSPLHGRFSREIMVLEWTGRKTGRRYSTPVGYVREDGRLAVFTHSRWWRNFQQPAQVRARIQGRWLAGTARAVSDPLEIRRLVSLLNRRHPPERARQMGFYLENAESASAAQLEQATRGVHFVEITLEGAVE